MDQYLKEIVKLLGQAAGFAALLLVVAFARLQPPWPPAIEYVSAVFILMAALVIWEWGRATKRAFRRRFVVAGIILTIFGIGAYLPAYSFLVDTVQTSGERVVRGTKCTEEAKRVYPGKCPALPMEALESAEWNPDVLWTRQSIMLAQLTLVSSWMCFIAGLVAFVGAVILGNRKP